MYKLYVRDQYLNRVAEIDDFQSFDFVQKFNAPGTWVLDLPNSAVAAKELVKKKAGIIVQKDNQIIFTGIVTLRKRSWNADGDILTVSGCDDLIHLQRAFAYPVPLGPPYTSKAYDMRTGKAEAIIKQYVDVNIGASARSDRRILTVESDKGLGNSVTGRARFHNLNDLASSLAIAGGGLGYKVTISNKQLLFQVYQPTDKTKKIIFSPLLSNLANFEYSIEDPETNYAIVGGGGEGIARTLLERGDSSSIAEYGRIETFIDRRDTTETTELIQAMNEELTSNARKTSLSISPIDTDSMKYGRDYNLGDKVSVVLTQPNEVINIETMHYFISAYQTAPVDVERVRKIEEKLELISDVVREIKTTITPSGVQITPTVGTNETNSNFVLGIFNKMKKINRRINNLERR